MSALKGLENLSPIEELVLQHLETVIDPEVGIDIVNLGLVYKVDVDEKNNALVTMTLTTMGCPLYETIHSDITNAVGQIKEINEVEVKLVWMPAWTPNNMTRYARIALGMY